MTPLAHFGGLPVEEVLLPLAYGGTGLWAAFRVRFLTRTLRRRGRTAAGVDGGRDGGGPDAEGRP